MTARELAEMIVRIPYHDDAHAEIVLEVATLIEAHDRELLAAAADRAVAYCRQFDGFFEGEDDLALRAAILGGKE